MSVRTEAPQKDLRPLQTSIRRGESDSAWTIFLFRCYLESYFEKRGENGSHKNSPSRFGFPLPRAFRWWSRNCRSPSAFFGYEFFVCFYWGSNPAVNLILTCRKQSDPRDRRPLFHLSRQPLMNCLLKTYSHSL